jgi:hypothetical protein
VNGNISSLYEKELLVTSLVIENRLRLTSGIFYNGVGIFERDSGAQTNLISKGY